MPKSMNENSRIKAVSINHEISNITTYENVEMAHAINCLFQ